MSFYCFIVLFRPSLYLLSPPFPFPFFLNASLFHFEKSDTRPASAFYLENESTAFDK